PRRSIFGCGQHAGGVRTERDARDAAFVTAQADGRAHAVSAPDAGEISIGFIGGSDVGSSTAGPGDDGSVVGAERGAPNAIIMGQDDGRSRAINAPDAGGAIPRAGDNASAVGAEGGAFHDVFMPMKDCDGQD